MIDILNSDGLKSNIFHFQGKSLSAYCGLFNELMDHKLVLPDNISVISCYNNSEKSILEKQLKKNKINLINCYKDTNSGWLNTLKIGYLVDKLQEINTDICIILDGNDVLINTFDEIIENFKKTDCRILFNATTNNYPDVVIDKIPNRDFMGRFRYFNAGCCIGYKDDLLVFYKKCLEFLNTNPYNPWKSEQFILRTVFQNEYLEKNKSDIKFDSNCIVFQTFANTKLYKYGDGDKFRVL